MATPDADGSAVPEPADERIKVLVQGGRWHFGDDPPVLKYAFEQDVGIDIPWDDGMKAIVQNALAQWAAVANLSFQEIPPGTDIDFSEADLAIALMGDFFPGATAIGIFPDEEAGTEVLEGFGIPEEEQEAAYPRPEGDIYFDNFESAFSFTAMGGAVHEVVLHEVGHALGLKHPEDGGLNDRPKVVTFDGKLSVMSQAAVPFPFDVGHAATPLIYDILAIQHIYGANLSYRTGDDVYFVEFDDAQRAIWDAGGVDTLDISHLPFGLAFSLADGQVLELSTYTQFGIAFGVEIENAVGGDFGDFITGNALDNRLDGGGGDDSLEGGGGNDTLAGGAGNDTYYITHGGEVIVELPGGGIDTVETELSVTLDDWVENVRLAGSAPGRAIGNSLGNVLTGNAAANTLVGGGGADTLVGGAGDDTYFLDAFDSVIDEGGHDTGIVQGSFFSTFASLEQVQLGGRAGNGTLGAVAANDRLVGNNGDNRIEGGAGNDTLEGGRGDDTLLGGAGHDRLDGGHGADVMEGGAGNDVYVVSGVRDRIVEAAAGGIDTVELHAARYALDANVENVVLLNPLGSFVTGNALANRFFFGALQGVDRILGFQHGIDKIVLEDAVFSNPAEVEYAASTGALLYEGVQFALLADHPAFAASDILFA